MNFFIFPYMTFYFFPLLAAALGWLFLFMLLRLFLSTHSNATFTLKNQIRIQKPGLAEAAGIYAEKEFNLDKLSGQFSASDLLQTLQPELESKVDTFIKEKLPQKWPMLGMFLNAEALEKIKTGLMEELQTMFPPLLQKLSGSLGAKMNIRGFAEQKILALSETEILEFFRVRIRKINSRIQWMGALMGFIIGLIAVLCFKILPA